MKFRMTQILPKMWDIEAATIELCMRKNLKYEQLQITIYIFRRGGDGRVFLSGM